MASSRKYLRVKYALQLTGSIQEDDKDDEEGYSSECSTDTPSIRYTHTRRKARHCSGSAIVEMNSIYKSKAFGKGDCSSALHVTLHQAARDGSTDVLRIFLDNLSPEATQMKLNELEENKLSPLHYASRYNHITVVQLLLERGADVNIKGEDGLTPLHFAARFGYHKQVRLQSQAQEVDSPTNPCQTVICLLVGKGALVNIKDEYGMTPLHYAAMRGNEVATQQLLNCPNINTEVYDKQEMTPLHCAANYSNEEVVEILLNSGAEPMVYDENMSTPLHLAATAGNKEIVNLLLDAVEKRNGPERVKELIEERNNSKSSALHLAVCKGNSDIVDILLEKGADVRVSRDNYSQPLHLAAVSGNVNIAKCLVNHGAQVNCLNAFRETPLHKAAAFNTLEIIDFLLQNGALIEARDNEHFTPLLLAATEGHTEAVDRLIAYGANIDAVDKMDRTVIFWAAQENHPLALKALLEHVDANSLINRCDRYDNSPLHIAASKGYQEIVQILLNHGAEIEQKNEDEETPLHLAAKHGHLFVAEYLLNQSKTIVTAEDEKSNTPLHVAASAGHHQMVSLLLNAGANVDARNCYLWTALDCAASRGWKLSSQILLNAGCPVDPMDKSKTTPLHLAAREGHRDVVKLLLKWGANIAQCDKDGKNCLDLAIDKGHRDVAIEILSDKNWEEVLRNESDRNKFNMHQTPLRRLIRRMPDVAEFVFNKCIKTNGLNEDHPRFEVTFSYEFLDDIFACYQPHLYSLVPGSGGSDSESSIFNGMNIYDKFGHVKPKAQPYTDSKEILKANHPLMLMVTYHRQSLLNHPLCTSLLQHKWNSYGRYVYYSNLLIYLLFLAFLTGYILTAHPPCPHEDISDPKCCFLLNTTCQPYIGECVSSLEHLFPEICKHFIYVFAIVHLIKELYQMYQNGSRYLTLENFLEWACYLTALLFVADITDCSAQTGIREVWQWELGSLAIFCAWMVLVMFISKFPFLGIYVIMFIQILSTFANFSIVFFLFVVAFALAFFALLQNQDPFETPGESIIKTGVMMIGELEFDSIFNDPDNKVYFKGPTYLLFVLFLLLMTIIIMNLLVGLAVDDIKGVQEQAELKRLAMKVELVLTVERILPVLALRRCVIKEKKVYPNAWQNWPWLLRIIRMKMSSAPTDESKATVEQLAEQQVEFSRQLTDVHEKLILLHKDTKKLCNLLESMKVEKCVVESNSV